MAYLTPTFVRCNDTFGCNRGDLRAPRADPEHADHIAGEGRARGVVAKTGSTARR